MITLIMGGSGSGKSAYAEDYVLTQAGESLKYYIATMQIYDAEGQRKVERHRKLRAGKGFITIEQPTDIAESVSGINGETGKNSIALLECMSNLVANEMFSGEQMPDVDTVVEEIVQGIASLTSQLSHLVIVSNNVFEDGIEYDETTLRYIEALGRINTRLAEMADHVVEVVVGIPVIKKKKIMYYAQMIILGGYDLFND